MSAAHKARLRAEALGRRDGLDPETRAKASAAIARHILDLSASFPPGPISIFWPIRSEIDTRPLMQKLKDAGFPVALPRVEGSSLEFRLWQAHVPLISGKFGLSEPSLDAPLTRPSTMLIPLAAFDRSGHRIGYGKGFYDRAIAALNPKRKIGLAFSCQEIEKVPAETHDEQLEMIVTEGGIITPRR